MTLSIRNTLRSLSLLALTAAFLPGCDSEEYEALGLSSEELDAMSEEDLDELAALEDDGELDHSVDPMIKPITAPRPPADPRDRPDDLTTASTDDAATRFDLPDTLWAPQHTHTGPGPFAVDVADTLWAPQHTHGNGFAVDVVDTLWDPQHTHGNGFAVDGADTLWDPQHTHAELAFDVVEGLAVPVHPTHGQPLVVSQVGMPDPGCKPHTEYPHLSNG